MSDVTIKIDTIHRDLLHALSEKRSLSMKLFIHGMIEYFEETDLDPMAKEKRIPEEIAKMKKEVLAGLKQTQNVCIGFIREQEKNKLSPMIRQINTITEILIRFLSEEALRKVDLESMFPKSSIQNQTLLEKTSIEDSRAIHFERMLKLARELFSNFLASGKRSTFGSGFIFDSATIDSFRNQFSNLK